MSEDPRRERILAELREQAARQREAGFEPVDDAEAAASMEALLRTVRAFNVAPPSFEPIKSPFERIEDMPDPVLEPVPIRPTTGADEGPALRPGGRPLKPVMRIEDAGRMQIAIDRALRNGHEPVISALAKGFGIKRDRAWQAIQLRRRGYDLRQSPAEFSAVSRTTGSVYWPAVKRPSKS